MESTSSQGKGTAVFAYLTIFGTLIAYFMNLDPKHPLASFHIRQALGIHITFYLLGVLVSMFDTWLISGPFLLFVFVLWGYGIISAFQGSTREVPLLGKQFQKWFRPVS